MTTMEIPDHFRCPISREVMEYPFTTAAGNTYEFSCIQKWLKHNSTDPLSGVRLQDKIIVPNNGLRSQILSWFEANPEAEEQCRNVDAVKPPPDAVNSRVGSQSQDSGLDRVIHYRGKLDAKKAAMQQKARAPPGFSAHGHKYKFSMGGFKNKTLMISCDNHAAVEAPETAVFATAQGLVFYDPSDVQDTRVLPGTDRADTCKFMNKCTKDNCSYAHPFVCPNGIACDNQHLNRCKFLHPEASSVEPLSAQRKTECKYTTACSNKSCKFAHPKGRLTIARTTVRVFVTHSLTLQVLAEPIPLQMTVPDKATRLHFQGEFAFFFEPYPGTWAKEHYKAAIVHRFDARSQSYREVGEYTLDRHYCNCVVGAGRYFVISFWPYEEESIRTIWECLRVGRSMEKTLRDKSREIESLKGQLQSKDVIIAEKDSYIQHLKQEIAQLKEVIRNKVQQIQQQRYEAKAAREAAAARREAYNQMKKQRQEEAAWRRQQLNQERARMERLRLRDPIQIFALQDGTSGFRKEDWVMVVDYHKGAHDLQLSLNDNGSAVLEVTEHDNVFCFDLVVPKNVYSIGTALPITPGRLCEEF